jgi:PPM family protein phosphatase
MSKLIQTHAAADGLKLSGIALTDVGRKREHNEDNVLLDLKRGIALVADGMGGYLAGEVASQLAVDTVYSKFPEPELDHTLAGRVDPVTGQSMAALRWRAAMAEANQQIFDAANVRTEQDGMGTTIVGGLFYGHTVCLGHIGDSRAYRLRAGELTQITRDHSLVQDQIDSGLMKAEDALTSGYKNLVTRALGIDALTEPDINEFRVQVGDTYLFCSDGLSDLVKQKTIQDTMLTASDLQQAAQQLIALANEAGGRDNISVVLVLIEALPKNDAAWWQKWAKNKS